MNTTASQQSTPRCATDPERVPNRFPNMASAKRHQLSLLRNGSDAIICEGEGGTGCVCEMRNIFGGRVLGASLETEFKPLFIRLAEEKDSTVSAPDASLSKLQVEFRLHALRERWQLLEDQLGRAVSRDEVAVWAKEGPPQLLCVRSSGNPSPRNQSQ